MCNAHAGSIVPLSGLCYNPQPSKYNIELQ